MLYTPTPLTWSEALTTAFIMFCLFYAVWKVFFESDYRMYKLERKAYLLESVKKLKEAGLYDDAKLLQDEIEKM